MPRPAAPRAPEFKQKDGREVEELRQELVRALARRDAIDRELRAAIDAIDVASGGAPAAAQYLCLAATGGLAFERVFIVGHGLDSVDAGPNGLFTVSVDESELIAASIGGFDDAVIDTVDATLIYHESDWAAQPNNVFADGVEVVDGISYTVVQTALAGPSWAIVNGSGFVWVPPTSATRSWGLASLNTAPYFYVPLSSIPGIDLQHPLIIDVHLTGQVYENGNDAVRIGLWEPAATPYATSTARVRMMDRGNFGGTSTIRSFDGSAVVTAAESFAPDSISLRVEPNGTSQIFYGTWAGGWPAQWRPALHNPTLATALNMFSLSARLTFVFINANDPTITTIATIANVRYRRG